MPKPSGISFNRYAAIAGRILRKSLKEDKRAIALKHDEVEVKAAKWENGKQQEAKLVDVVAPSN